MSVHVTDVVLVIQSETNLNPDLTKQHNGSTHYLLSQVMSCDGSVRPHARIANFSFHCIWSGMSAVRTALFVNVFHHIGLSLPSLRGPTHFPDVTRVRLPDMEVLPLLSHAAPPRPPPPPDCHRPVRDGDDDQGFNFGRFYLRMLDKHTFITKVITSAILSSVSDLIVQKLEANEKIDLLRNVAFFLTGAVLTAPLFHVLYELFEHTIPATNVTNLVLQVACDQLIAAPLWLLAFFPFIAVIEGCTDLSEIANTIRQKYVDGLKVTWIVFPAVQVVNFTLVPKHLRVLVVNICDLVYTALLSWLAHRGKST